MAADYQYFGFYLDGGSVDDPAGLFRTWTTPDGIRHEEHFTRDLVWRPSAWTNPTVRPGGEFDEDYGPISEAAAFRLILSVRDRQSRGESLAELLEARPLTWLRIGKVTAEEATALILSAYRPPDAAWREYITSQSDPVLRAHVDADDEGRLRLRDAAERLLLEHGDDSPVAAVGVLSWSRWSFYEPDRLGRLVDSYLAHPPIHLVGRVLWSQAGFLGAAQVRALEAVAATDPLRHLPVCAAVFKQSHDAVGTAWDAMAGLLGTSTDLATLARLYDTVARSWGPASPLKIFRERGLPRAMIDDIEARSHGYDDRFVARY